MLVLVLMSVLALASVAEKKWEWVSWRRWERKVWWVAWLLLGEKEQHRCAMRWLTHQKEPLVVGVRKV